MNNLPDDDPKLTNFLHQYRSLAPPAAINLEEQLMSEIALHPINNRSKNIRRIAGLIGILATGTLGMTIYHLTHPPELSVAEVHQLDRFLIDRSHGFVVEPVATETNNNDDLDAFIWRSVDPENL